METNTETMTALERQMLALQKAWSAPDDLRQSFVPMATMECVRILRGTVSNARNRAEKQGLPWDGADATALIDKMQDATSYDEAANLAAQVTACCDEVPKAEKGAALLPLSAEELLALEPVKLAILAVFDSEGLGTAERNAAWGFIRRAIPAWRHGG